MSVFFLLTGDSSEEEEVKEVTEEEYEIDVDHSWMEVGVSSIGRGASMGVVVAGISLYLLWLSLSNHSFTVLWLSLVFVTDPFFSFQGLGLLKWASSLWGEVQWLEMEGLQKIELAVAGLEVEGLYGIRRGAVSLSPMSSTPPLPKNATMLPPAPYPICPLRSLKKSNLKPPLLQLEGLNWHWRLPVQLSPKLWR